MEKLSEGAESIIEIVNSTTLQKTRLEKPYRNQELDLKLRKFRTKREFKILAKLYEEKIKVPKPISLQKTEFTFEYLQGETLKNCLSEELLNLAFKEIIRMHKVGITHGDLTTLNMMKVKDKVYLIDFGLAQFSENIEERGVDLNLFFTCIENEHPEFFHMKSKLLKEYEKVLGKETLKRLEQIEHRGRNKNK